MSSEKDKDRSPTPPIATHIILESISDGVFTVDQECRITYFNRAAEELTQVPRQEALGSLCSEVFKASFCESGCAFRKALESGQAVINQTGYIINTEGRRIPISLSTALLQDENGNFVGGVETFRDLSLVEELRRELECRYEIGDILSHSPAMRPIFEILPQVSATNSTVLIQGETGTGKELLARAIHQMSPRRQAPFVAINCGALPDTLLESELFGYKAGAFTGAEKDKPGRFALAENGTLLLDEIGDISPALQIRLLRVLQEKVYEPLGSNLPVRTNARILAATNKNLEELANSGVFRIDLFYRINVIRLELPPLRSRKEDIPLLTRHFIEKFNRESNRSVAGLTKESMAILLSYNYPGNIRELENILEHACVLSEDGFIELHHLPSHLSGSSAPPPIASDFASRLKEVETQTLLEILKKNRYNRLATAKELGIHKSTLFRKIKALGLNLPQPDRRHH